MLDDNQVSGRLRLAAIVPPRFRSFTPIRLVGVAEYSPRIRWQKLRD